MIPGAAAGRRMPGTIVCFVLQRVLGRGGSAHGDASEALLAELARQVGRDTQISNDPG
jgi:hypothetical protein